MGSLIRSVLSRCTPRGVIATLLGQITVRASRCVPAGELHSPPGLGFWLRRLITVPLGLMGVGRGLDGALYICNTERLGPRWFEAKRLFGRLSLASCRELHFNCVWWYTLGLHNVGKNSFDFIHTHTGLSVTRGCKPPHIRPPSKNNLYKASFHQMKQHYSLACVYLSTQAPDILSPAVLSKLS